MRFTKVEVTCFDRDICGISWVPDYEQDSALDWSVCLLRSGSPAGEFQILSQSFVNTVQILDTSARLTNAVKRWFYQLQATKIKEGPDKGITAVSDIVTLEAAPCLAGLEIARRYREIYLQRFGGRPCLVYKIRSTGDKCPECYSSIKQRPVRTGCTTCYGTNLVGGFYPPILTYIAIGTATDVISSGPSGDSTGKMLNASAPNYPVLAPRDIIIELENIRWVVAQRSPIQVLRFTTQQQLTLHELNRRDPAYTLPMTTLEELRDSSIDAGTWPLPHIPFENRQRVP